MEKSNLAKINEVNADKVLSEQRHQALIDSNTKVSSTVLSATTSLIRYLEGHTTKTQVVNQLKSINTPDALRVIPAIKDLHETIKKHENTDLSEITKVMKDVLEEAKKLPKELPKTEKQQFIDYSNQFKSLSEAVKAVEKVVKEQKLVAEAPIVNVPEANVNVEAPDLLPLQSSITDVVKAVEKIVIPEYKTDNKAVEKLIKDSNKLLKGILDKPVSSGGGGGGGRATPYADSAGIPAFVTLTADGKVPVEAGATSTYQSFNDTTTDVNLVYLGKAVAGTDATDAAWQIKRYNKSAGTMTFADDITTFTKQWSARTGYTY
jgi:hypothetical protein